MLKTGKMFHRLTTIILVLFWSLGLFGCAAQTGGMPKYTSLEKGYEFVYPNGWIKVEVENASPGVDVVFRDLIERSENLSLIISNTGDNQTLGELGTPTEVGYRFMKQVNQDPQLNRTAELISASTREDDQHNTYYILEYQVTPPSGSVRHNLATVVVSENKLYTLNLASSQQRWHQVKTLFEAVVNSFSVT